ncbi:hypothetical protein MFIFM68171_06675 [Madurella fahalii]|uniref:Ankyrin n=1 Tax=Madurella fahalii TaxID=1157608 RepID=A0ABQ0GFJ7_9PEZI
MPLHIAARIENTYICRCLVRYGAPMTECNVAGDAPIHIAVRTGNGALVSYLIDPGSPIDIRNTRTEDTPLHIAVQEGDIDILEGLFARGADVTLRNGQGTSPYELACYSGRVEVQAAFLNFGRW